MVSRDIKDLHPELAKRFNYLLSQWEKLYPDGPTPFLICTYRSPDEQARLVETGKSQAQAFQSLHNYQPACAFDVGMRYPSGAVTWDWLYYQKWGELAKELGLVWGGDWPFRDGCHVQFDMTWQQAKAGQYPKLPPLPNEHKPRTEKDRAMEFLKLAMEVVEAME